jgi:hypothetical protein
MKRIGLLLIGIASLLMSAGFIGVLIAYLFGGAGLQFSTPWISPESVLVGWIHVMGFALASALTFALGAWWCADALVSRPAREVRKSTRSGPPSNDKG